MINGEKLIKYLEAELLRATQIEMASMAEGLDSAQHDMGYSNGLMEALDITRRIVGENYKESI